MQHRENGSGAGLILAERRRESVECADFDDSAPPASCEFLAGDACPGRCERLDALERSGIALGPAPDREGQLETWSRTVLASSIPHKAAIFGFGRFQMAGLVVDRVVCVNLGDQYVHGLCEAARELRSPALHLWHQKRAPVFLQLPDLGGIENPKWRSNFLRHGFENCLADGLLAPIAGRFSFLTLFDVCGDVYRCPKALREIATLPAHKMWLKGANGCTASKARREFNLTPAERELIKVLREGKGNKGIAKALGKSPATVKTQLQRLYRKTATANRTELLARVLEIS